MQVPRCRIIASRGFPRLQFTDLQPKLTAKLVAIGVEDSVWRVLGAELISTGEWLVTPKARSGAGLLPEVNPNAIPKADKTEVMKAIDHMVDVGHRETRGSIVDVAKNTAAFLMNVYAAALESKPEEQKKILGKDLGQICNHFRQKDGLKDRNVVICTGDILARLRPRKKYNEQQRYNLCPITEEDATFAVSAIGLLLNEFRWTYERAARASAVTAVVVNP